MNLKAARLVRQINWAQKVQIPDGSVQPAQRLSRRQRTQLKRSLSLMTHRERGERQGHWRAIVAGIRLASEQPEVAE